MAKVKEIFGAASAFQVNPLDIESIDQNRIWVHYDMEADSLVIYTTGKPTRAVSVSLDNNTYIKVDPKSRDIVGFHFEKWERKFIPTHPELQPIWNEIQPMIEPEPGWNHLLRVLALWIIFLLRPKQPIATQDNEALVGVFV